MKNMRELKTWQYNVAIAFIASLLFIPFLGGVHLFDWDEINFAESAREMLVSKDYLTVQINFVPFWEKPPLFIWMQVLSMKVFGINEFAARFPNAICGVFSLLVLFNFGRKLKDTRFGLLWTAMYLGSMLPFFYFKSGIIDPWFNLFIFLAIHQIYLYFERQHNMLIHAAGSAFFIGLAVLTKGPVALLIFMLTVGSFLLVRKFMVKIRLRDIFIFIIVLSITGGMWFILQIMNGNLSIIADFIVYQIRLFKTQDAGHGGFLFYHFVVLFAGVFPASIIGLPALFPSKYASVKDYSYYIWMLILFWIVLILFTIVRTKIVHYSSLCYFPVTFFAAWAIYHSDISFTTAWKKWISRLLIPLGIMLSLIMLLLPLTDQLKSILISHHWVTDPFALSELSADGGWKGYEFLPGVFLAGGLLVFGFLKSENLSKALLSFTLIMPIVMLLCMFLIVPRVETYSQRAAIEFFKSVSDEDAYLTTIGYKSYAHYFYGQIKDHPMDKSRDKEWLLNGNIDKPVYFSMKITRKEKFLREYPSVQYLYEKNGFAFFKRVP